MEGKVGVLEYWSDGKKLKISDDRGKKEWVMGNEKEPEQGISEVNGLERCHRILCIDM